MRSPKLRLAMRVQAGGGEQRREGRGGSSQQSGPGPPRTDRETVNKSAVVMEPESLQNVERNGKG